MFTRAFCLLLIFVATHSFSSDLNFKKQFDPFGEIRWSDDLFTAINKLQSITGIKSIKLERLPKPMIGGTRSLELIVDLTKTKQKSNEDNNKIITTLQKHYDFTFSLSEPLTFKKVDGSEIKYRNVDTLILSASPIFINGVECTVSLNFFINSDLFIKESDPRILKLTKDVFVPLKLNTVKLFSNQPSVTLTSEHKNIRKILVDKYITLDMFELPEPKSAEESSTEVAEGEPLTREALMAQAKKEYLAETSTLTFNNVVTTVMESELEIVYSENEERVQLEEAAELYNKEIEAKENERKKAIEEKSAQEGKNMSNSL